MGLQFMMSKETETLKNLLRSGTVDSAAVLKQIDQMLGVEREVKRTQLSLMIKIKNTLTPQQQATLDQIRARGRDQ
jgi:Spy/CpxP family protein refolding chaperone